MDIKDHMSLSLKFIDDKKPNADAAYERLKVIRKATKDLRRVINDTDTRSMTQQHIEQYNTLYENLVTIEAWEQLIIKEGE